jgi:cobalamin biosynthesis protein CbiG
MDYTTVIRELIDKLEAISRSVGDDTHGACDDERTDDAQPMMMPPQTQKLELLKKAVGVESQYDDDCEEDEIAELKRRAGINPAAIDALGDELLD